MAERRMLAKTIITSDAFTEMPQSTQLLYFYLAMQGDDDGFVNNPKAIMRNAGCKEDDMSILIAKKFIIPFESGIVVIKHWRIHNYIAKDRYTETKYKEEKASLSLDENSAYTKCIQPVYRMDTQVRLGEDSLGKESEKQKDITEKSNKEEKHKHGEYKHILLSSTEYIKLVEEWGEPELLRMIKNLDEGIEIKNYKYKNFNLTLRNWKKNDRGIPIPKPSLSGRTDITPVCHDCKKELDKYNTCPQCGKEYDLLGRPI